MRNLRARMAASLLLLTSGCYVDAYSGYDDPYYEPPPPPPPRYAEGMLVVEWSIAGAIGPYECASSDSYGAAIIIETPRGGLVREVTEDCDAFGAFVALPPGAYVATVVLLDADGYDRTTAVTAPIRIYDGYETDFPVDFPPDSFY